MQARPPFSRDDQLNTELTINQNGDLVYNTPSARTNLPGQALISLTRNDIDAYISKEFLTPDLNKMTPYFWLITTQSSTSISTLTEQLVRGRQITISEDPELHLVWLHNRIFLKPIPAFLFSHAFWEMLVTTSSLPNHRRCAQAILGFMRSYTCMIRHRSDFRLAVENHLFPEEVKDYHDFTRFIRYFGHEWIADHEVSDRYRYGQLRLSRLNLWAKFALGRWSFRWVHWQYSSYFATFYAPLLFVFAILSVALSASQVGLASGLQDWGGFQALAEVIVVLTLVAIAVCAGTLLTILVMKILLELVFALRKKG